LQKVLNDVIKTNSSSYSFHVLYSSNSLLHWTHSFFFFLFSFFFVFVIHFLQLILFIHFCLFKMTSKRLFAHQRSETIAYVETQRRRQLNITSEKTNVDHFSNSTLSSVFTMFTSSSSRTASVDDKIFTTDRKSIEKKYAKKMSRVKKRKIIHKASVYFYDSLYDNLLIVCWLRLIDKTLRKIKVMQKSTNLLMSRLSFQRVIKKIMKNEERTKKQHMMNLRIQRSALNALQKITKDFFIEIFESESTIIWILWTWDINIMRSVINLLTIHVKRITIQVKNMQLLNQLRKNMTSFDKLYEHFEIYTQVVNQIRLRSQCWKDQLQIDINKIEERIICWCDVCEAWKDEKFR
jgi:histone H3/H4